ncbi:hypothetical protein GALMADRAFT_280180 [Galerina marginata CBS 339.88]|uniref:Uncharacterized protein n=1 Tax=Galerina marginata (strain CBS 339.88) TaxID=685588 RepID=A0A067T4H0_GALM3|nr:hypothetical protein GALMADRAFT_280180 [Galerina marginata CBS 339.88]
MIPPTVPLFLAIALTLINFAFAFTNPVYIISNAETPSLKLPGLTPVGKKRVQNCLPPLLAPLDIGLIVTCPFDPDSGLCSETIATATPIAQSLNLNITTKCGADEETDDDCVPDLLKAFAKNSTQSMLVIWDLDDMDSLFENLDVDDGDDDDDDDDDDDTPHFDLLTTVVKNKVSSIVSQGCQGIDGQAAGTFRRSLKYKRGLKKRQISSRIAGA